VSRTAWYAAYVYAAVLAVPLILIVIIAFAWHAITHPDRRRWEWSAGPDTDLQQARADEQTAEHIWALPAHDPRCTP
jgi:hypothetical protein